MIKINNFVASKRIFLAKQRRDGGLGGWQRPLQDSLTIHQIFGHGGFQRLPNIMICKTKKPIQFFKSVHQSILFKKGFLSTCCVVLFLLLVATQWLSCHWTSWAKEKLLSKYYQEDYQKPYQTNKNIIKILPRRLSKILWKQQKYHQNIIKILQLNDQVAAEQVGQKKEKLGNHWISATGKLTYTVRFKS